MSSNAVIVHPQRRNIFDRLPNEMIVKIAESMGPEDRATFSMFSSRTNRVVGDRRYDDNVREGELSLVRVAAQAGNIEILERLERLARDDVVNWNVLPPTNPDIQDVDMDDVEWIDFLDDDADGWTALHIAAAFGNENIINFLWERGVPIDTPDTTMPIGLTPLFYAAHSENADEMLPILQAYGADIDALVYERSEPLIAYVIREGRYQTAVSLLRAGANHTYEDHHQKTLLHLCCQADPSGTDPDDWYELINQLISMEVDATGVDDRGFTPLHYAVQRQHGWDIRPYSLLIEAGASIDKDTNNEGETVFALLCKAGYTSSQAVQRLDRVIARWKIDLEQEDDKKATCLYRALENSLHRLKDSLPMKVANTLLRHGASPDDHFEWFIKMPGSEALSNLLAYHGAMDGYSEANMEGLYDSALESGDQEFVSRVFDNWLDRYEGYADEWYYAWVRRKRGLDTDDEEQYDDEEEEEKDDEDNEDNEDDEDDEGNEDDEDDENAEDDEDNEDNEDDEDNEENEDEK